MKRFATFRVFDRGAYALRHGGLSGVRRPFLVEAAVQQPSAVTTTVNQTSISEQLQEVSSDGWFIAGGDTGDCPYADTWLRLRHPIRASRAFSLARLLSLGAVPPQIPSCVPVAMAYTRHAPATSQTWQ